MKKNENLEMLKIIAMDVLTDALWRLAYRWNIGSKEKATARWIVIQCRKANWCARHVWFGSEWHGMNCQIAFNSFVADGHIDVTVKGIQQ